MIVFSQFNYAKPDGFMLFYCQILLNSQDTYALMHVRSLSDSKEDFYSLSCQRVYFME